MPFSLLVSSLAHLSLLYIRLSTLELNEANIQPFYRGIFMGHRDPSRRIPPGTISRALCRP